MGLTTVQCYCAACDCILQFNVVSCVLCTDEEPHMLASITRLKSQLSDLIEPDFGLLDHLLSLHVLTLKEFVDVRSQKTMRRRSVALLDLLTTGDQCDMFVKALQRTGQQHVANFIMQNGGQTECSYTSMLLESAVIAVEQYWKLSTVGSYMYLLSDINQHLRTLCIEMGRNLYCGGLVLFQF